MPDDLRPVAPPTMRSTTAADDPAVAALIGECFPANPKADATVLRWQYHDNPFGPPVGRVWVDNERIVAHYSAFAMPYLLQGKRCVVANAVDAAVAPSHQGRRLFTPLAEALYDGCAEAGMPVAVCYASNPIAMQGVARAGVEWRPRLRTLVVALDPEWMSGRFHLPGTAGRVLRRAMFDLGRGTTGCEVSGPPGDVEDLWQRTRAAGAIMNGVDRGASWWDWRYARSPLGQYQYVEVREAGRLTAAAVTTVRDAFGGRFACLLELLAVDADAARAALRTIATLPGASGVASVAVEGGPLHRLATAAGMRALPRRLEPGGGAWFGLVDTNGDAHHSSARWHIGWGDMDHL